jgi:hypothetical protein
MGKVRGRPFPPGNSFGQGRPKGSKNQATLLVQKLLGDHAESITRKIVIQALQGDRHAQRLCMERLSAPQRNVPLRMHLGPTKTAAEVDVASQRVLRAVANGSIPPADGEILANILELRRRAIESAEFEARLAKLEREAADGP